MATKRRKNVLSVYVKLDAINRLDKGELPTKLAAELNVGISTISNWKTGREKLEKKARTLSAPEQKKQKICGTSYFEDLENVLFAWFTQQRFQGIPLDGSMIRAKALQFAKKMYGTDIQFVASQGWLDKFKKRHGIRQLSISGEKLSADKEGAEKFKAEFAEMVIGYSPQLLFNADESGLIWKSLPKKSLASKLEKSAPGFKMCKQRLTIMACANAAGNLKLPLMMIGQSAKPRALKNLNFSSLPVHYKNQKKGWMTRQLFQEWFHKQFVPAVKKFCFDNNLPPKAILFIDNAPSHPDKNMLVSGDIKVEYLPPNVTSILQPLDQNVLQNVKAGYRKKLLTRLIEDDENSTIPEKLKKITIKDVIYWVADAWEGISPQLLQKSWGKVWPDFSIETISKDATKETEIISDRTLSLFNQISGCEVASEEDLREWLNPPGEANEFLEDDELIDNVINTNQDQQESEDEEEDVRKKVSHSRAATALETALLYVEEHPTALPVDIMFLRKWLNIAETGQSKLSKQSKLNDFFV